MPALGRELITLALVLLSTTTRYATANNPIGSRECQPAKAEAVHWCTATTSWQLQQAHGTCTADGVVAPSTTSTECGMEGVASDRAVDSKQGSTWGTFIVRFTNYKLVSEHKHLLQQVRAVTAK